MTRKARSPRPETLQHEPARNELCERTGRSGSRASYLPIKSSAVWVYTQTFGVC